MSADHQSEVIRAQLISKAVLRPDETELYELTQLAGVTMDPHVFKILLDLLKMNVPPTAIVQTLRSMCSPHHHGNISSSHPKAASLGRGEPHPNVTLSRGDSSQGHHSLPHQYDSSHLAAGDARVRATNRERDERSSSREPNRKKNSDFQNGSSYLSYTSTARENYSSYDEAKPTPDMSYGSYRSKSSDKSGHHSSSRADSYVTTRPRSTANSSTNEYKDKHKKRTSYH